MPLLDRRNHYHRSHNLGSAINHRFRSWALSWRPGRQPGQQTWRTPVVAIVTSALLAWLMQGATTADVQNNQNIQTPEVHGDAQYQPTVGQDGKNVIWVPTTDALMQAMLEIVKIQGDDILYDLGSGDGKIVIGAAQRYGIKAIGIEYSSDLVSLAERNALRAGVSDKVTFIRGDIFKEDFSKASVLTLYLLPELNLKLKPTILAMRAGTRVVSNTFHMGTWPADTTFELEGGKRGYFWVVPAQVEGRWQLGYPASEPATELEIRQEFQMLSGRMMHNGESLTILSGRMQGETITFSYGTRSPAGDTTRGTFQGTVRAGRLKGTLSAQGEKRQMAGRLMGQGQQARE